jgi:hypothetical protein
MDCNGQRGPDGYCFFETCDPMFFLPVEGELASVTVQGMWEVADIQSSFAKTQVLCNNLKAQVHSLRQQVQALLDNAKHCERDKHGILKSRTLHWMSAVRLLLRNAKASVRRYRRDVRQEEETGPS